MLATCRECLSRNPRPGPASVGALLLLADEALYVRERDRPAVVLIIVIAAGIIPALVCGRPAPQLLVALPPLP
jgi:hypothetical protein